MRYQDARNGCVVLACAVFMAGCTKSPESTVKSFYFAVEKGEITEAKSYLSAQLVSMIGGKLPAVLSQEMNQIRACGGLKSVEVSLQGGAEVRSGTTVVTYAGACQAKTENTKLIKEDGKWKITANK